MWYISANYDEEVFDDPYRLRRRPTPERPRRRSAAAGRTTASARSSRGSRSAILLEEILARNIRFELDGPAKRLRSNFVNGIESMPVRVVHR